MSVSRILNKKKNKKYQLCYKHRSSQSYHGRNEPSFFAMGQVVEMAGRKVRPRQQINATVI